MTQNILVLGGNGFIGKSLVKTLTSGSCFESVEMELNRKTKLKAINEQSNYHIMHHNGFGETNGFAS
jgi:nucleoside-diphosphate-sugar epimerase